MFKKEEFKILWPFYLAEFIDCSFSLITAYFILYFLDIGLSLFQTSIILSISCFTTVLFEIPTGAIADIYGRKFSVILSYLFAALILVLVPLSSNFYYLFFLFLIWGITDTLRSGADEAWVVSNLESKKKSHLIETYYAKTVSVGNFGLVIAPLIAAFVVSALNMSYLWTFTGVATLIAGLILLLAEEKFVREKIRVKESLNRTIKQAKDSVRYGLKHPIIFKILIASIFLLFVIAASWLLWQPYLKEFNFPLPYFGYLKSFISLLAVAVPMITVRFAKKFSKTSKYLSLLILIFLIILASVYFISTVTLAVAAVVLIYLATDFIQPVEQPFFQKFVPGKMRATLGSFKSTVGVLGVGLATIIIGFLADIIGPKNAFVSLCVFLIPTLIFYLKIGKHKH